MSNEEYPECEKLARVSAERATLSDFFEWLNQRGMFLCTYTYAPDSSRPWPVSESDDTLIMQYLEIDQIALEKERRAMLARLSELS